MDACMKKLYIKYVALLFASWIFARLVAGMILAWWPGVWDIPTESGGVVKVGQATIPLLVECFFSFCVAFVMARDLWAEIRRVWPILAVTCVDAEGGIIFFLLYVAFKKFKIVT